MIDENEEKKAANTALIAEACNAYGVDPEHIFSAYIDEETGAAVIGAGNEAKVYYKPGPVLIAEACSAYGIEPQYIFSSRIEEATGAAVIVTNGGAKVFYKPGDEVKPLGEIAITGVNPENAKRNPIGGKEIPGEPVSPVEKRRKK
jgi:hypothetical protein